MIRIIIVDDLKPLVEELELIVHSIPDMEVIGTAGSGQEALALSRETDFDLMLLDIEMEDSSAGVKAAREIIHEKPKANIAFLTAHDNKDMILAAMATGAIDYIVKGLPDDKLIDKIKKIASGTPELDNKIQALLLNEYKRLRNTERGIMETMNKIKRLTNAETELVGYLLEGKSQRQISQVRHVELVTIKTQISSIIKKFEVKRSRDIVNLIKELDLQNLFIS